MLGLSRGSPSALPSTGRVFLQGPWRSQWPCIVILVLLGSDQACVAISTPSLLSGLILQFFSLQVVVTFLDMSLASSFRTHRLQY
jgi:hypothetical protein